MREMATLTTGTQIKALRVVRGLSLRQLAQQARVNAATLSRWETDQRVPSIPELDATLTALEATDIQKRAILRSIHAPRALSKLRTLPDAGADGATGCGDLLWAMRQRKGWTQAQTARCAGVQQAQIARWEAGETWPGNADLHALCYALNASLEEVAALTTQTFAVPTLDKNPLYKRNDEAWGTYARSLLGRPVSEATTPLILICAEQRFLWYAASCPDRQDFALRLMADVYAIHARLHHVLGQPRQATRWAERGLTLARRYARTWKTGKTLHNEKPSYWFGSVLAQAEYWSHNERPAALRQAARLLRDYLPAIRESDPHFTWGQMKVAECIAREDAGEALALGQAVCARSERMNPEEGYNRWSDFCDLALKAGKPAQALHALTRANYWGKQIENRPPNMQARYDLQQAECLWASGDKTGASIALAAARQTIETQQWGYLAADLHRVTALMQKVTG